MFLICSHHSDRHLLGIGTEVVERFDRRSIACLVVVEVAIDVMPFQFGIVCIGIRAITTAIDISADTRMDADGITAIDTSRDVVTAIYVVDVATANDDASRKSCGEAERGGSCW